MKLYFEEAQNRTHYPFKLVDDDDEYAQKYAKICEEQRENATRDNTTLMEGICLKKKDADAPKVEKKADAKEDKKEGKEEKKKAGKDDEKKEGKDEKKKSKEEEKKESTKEEEKKEAPEEKKEPAKQ